MRRAELVPVRQRFLVWICLVFEHLSILPQTSDGASARCRIH